MSPTTILCSAAHAGHAGDSAVGGEGCTRGGGRLGGYLGGLYRYYPPTAPRTHISVIFSLKALPTAK